MLIIYKMLSEFSPISRLGMNKMSELQELLSTAAESKSCFMNSLNMDLPTSLTSSVGHISKMKRTDFKLILRLYTRHDCHILY